MNYTRNMLKSKIHRATVTDANIDYEGSISICPTLMFLADITEYECVHVWNITNGSRLITYALEGKHGEICINGAGAKLTNKGDLVIIATFTTLMDWNTNNVFESSNAIKDHKPRIICLDENNKVKKL